MALLEKTQTMLGPLPEDRRREIAQYLTWPTEEGWNQVRQILIRGGEGYKTLWQLVIAADPLYIMARQPSARKPDKWVTIPDALFLARLIKKHVQAPLPAPRYPDFWDNLS